MVKRPRTAGKPPRVPSYCHHKGTGQAYIKVKGRFVYLGPYGSPESRDAYAAAVADVLTGKPPAPTPRATAATPSASMMTVAEVCRRFTPVRRGLLHEERQGHGRGGYGGHRLRPCGGIVRRRAGRCVWAAGPADRPGPPGCHRAGPIHRQRLSPANPAGVRWAAGRGANSARRSPPRWPWSMGLRAGRTTAREPAPVLPVADNVVEATVPHLPEVVTDMVRLQRLTGVRPGEVCILRPMDLDRSGDVWVYRPESHKTRTPRPGANHQHRPQGASGPPALPGPRRQSLLLFARPTARPSGGPKLHASADHPVCPAATDPGPTSARLPSTSRATATPQQLRPGRSPGLRAGVPGARGAEPGRGEAVAITTGGRPTNCGTRPRPKPGPWRGLKRPK